MRSRRPSERVAMLALLACFALVPARASGRARARTPASVVVVDGAAVQVRWIDGDTFRFLDGDREGASARLEGFNTLESYGAVHRWGAWQGADLLALAREATRIAASRSWSCTTRGRQDRYRRVLVSCPDLAAELVRSGHAMVFAVGARPGAALLELQSDAQRRRAGMWAKGVPAQLLSSVHSRTENGVGATYDRVVDTRTGEARPRPHDHSYRTCEEVCVGEGDGRACMLYVPFERRYRNRPGCLRSEAAGEGEPVRQRHQ